MIFTPDHCDKIRHGTKTQTRRLKRGSYKVGGVYAVQPGRGKKAVGHIRMKRIWQQNPALISDKEVQAEGFETWRQFFGAFRKSYYLLWEAAHKIWAFEFEAVAHQEWPR